MIKIISRTGKEYYYDHISNNFFSSSIPSMLKSENKFEEMMSQCSDKPQPESLVINLTNNCNMRCAYCAYSGAYYFQRSHEMRHIDIEIAKRAVDIYFDHSFGKKGV